jgi:GT2 family glycosyltransferase
MKDISVILINYNSSKYTIPCVESILKLTDSIINYDVIIVDNNSKIEDYNLVRNFATNYKNIHVYRSKINLGFSGGNMFGVQYTNSKYVFFLNNDTLLLNDCLSILFKFMKEHDTVGICSGQMYNTDQSFHKSFSYFPTVGMKLLGPGFLRLFNKAKYPKSKKEYTTPLKVDFVTGAAMFVDFEKFASIGGFDTNMFLYCEEEELTLRLNKNGYSAYLNPEAKFIHHMGKSTNRNLNVEKENYISLLYYQRKHNSVLSYSILKFFYFFKHIKKTYKHLDYLKLAIFILRGAPMKYSLKHKQKISTY